MAVSSGGNYKGFYCLGLSNVAVGSAIKTNDRPLRKKFTTKILKYHPWNMDMVN